MICWIAPGGTAGHATRAAAIARHLETPVVVIVSPGRSQALDESGVSYVEVAWADMAPTVADINAEFVIGDYDPAARGLPLVSPDLWVWRLGRQRTDLPTLAVEGPGACWPILLLDPEEILDRAAARAELGLDPERHIRMLIPGGTDGGWFMKIPHEVTLERRPALRWLQAADLVIGHIGLNLWSEVTSLKIPARWMVRPDRPDQALRLGSVPPLFVADAARRAASAIERFAGGGQWVPPTA